MADTCLDPSVFLITLLAVAALVLIVVVAFRWTRLRHEEYLAMALESDAALKRLAQRTGLSFLPGAGARHPTLGSIPAFGRAEGTYRGFGARIGVVAEEVVEPPLVFRTEIHLEVPAGKVFEPTRAGVAAGRDAEAFEVTESSVVYQLPASARARSQSYVFFLVTDADALAHELGMVCTVAEEMVRRA